MSEESKEKAKRTVKNPETFRERAIKSTEASERPKKTAKVRKTTRAIIAKLFHPFGVFFKRLFKIPPFNLIAKLAKWIGLVIFPIYLRNSLKELKYVTWPNLKQSRQLTVAVLIFAIVFGTAVALVDVGLDRLFKHILLK
jgi:preprotein translocase SecE subunit